MKNSKLKFVWTLLAVSTVGLLASCGGGNGTQQLQPPPPLTITTTSLPGTFYGEFYTATLQSSGGTGAKTWSISSGSLPGGLNLDHDRGIISGIPNLPITSTFNVDVTVQDSASKAATRAFVLSQDERPARIFTTTLPDAVIGRPYQVQLATSQPNNPISIDLAQGLPPAWLSTGGQTLFGMPIAPAGQFSFVVRLSTSGVPVEQRLNLNVVGMGTTSRNDDILNARPLSSGLYIASISPLVDPVTGTVPGPDNDYYRLTAQPGNTVSIDIRAERDGTPLDSVIELVDSAGARLNTCNSPGESTFANPCLNDDNLEDGTLDSRLLFRVPGGAPSTFFLHVVDWRGDGRPDMLYRLEIFGVD